MTTEPPPPFDLYRELEVSRRASAAVIEAAYRSLVRRHDADASGSTDGDRAKRLNTARTWLTDPVRRSRYDAAMGPATASRGDASPSRTSSRAAGDPPRARPRPESSQVPARSFGPNAAEVRQFLGDLRGLDWDRALRVFERRTVADAGDYENARRAVEAIARTKRLEAWLFAREAASVIVRGGLGVSAATDQVLHLVVDAVGAIAIRDLVPPSVLDVLLLPWSRGDEPVPSSRPTAPNPANAEPGVMPQAPATTSAPPAPPAVEEPAIPSRPAAGLGARLPVPAWFMAGFAIVALISVGSGIASLNQPEASLAAVGATDGHSPTSAATVAADTSLPTATMTPTLAPASPSTGATDPPASPGNIAVGPTPGPAPTPRPRQTPAPAGTPVPEGTPGPAPTPAPTAAPTPMCTVPSLIDVRSVLAQRDWWAAGFSGTVVFSPVVPPHYEIKSQSLPAGSSVECASGITVTD